MLKTIALASALAQLGLALATPAGAQLLTHTDLSLDTALAIAQGAMAACKAKGHRVSVTVVGRLGEVIVQLRGDNASPYTPESSFRKAYTARAFRAPTEQLSAFLYRPGQPPQPETTLPDILALQGGAPITVGNDVIGGVGVTGAGGTSADQECAAMGLKSAADQLK